MGDHWGRKPLPAGGLLVANMSNNVSKTLINILNDNAVHYPNKLAYTFLSENKTYSLTNKELLQKVIGIASRLLDVVQPGARAILLLPPGLDYIASFLGCLMAGIVAVPAYPPRGNRHAQRIVSIINDAKAELIITTSAMAQQYTFEHVTLIAVDDEIPELSSVPSFPQLLLNDLAFLQYTSSSTGAPKGVMVTHGNIIANTTAIDALFQGKGETLCSWLPPFHDMGLIGAILYPLAYHMHSVLMAPTTFLKTPFFWLKAISDYRANIAPAPNFSYEMCVSSITDEEKKHLDLSHWLVALNGAEPVSAKTLVRFSEAFSACGFQAEFCYPAYGMAETTLMVCGKKPGSSTTVLQVDRKTLQETHDVQLYDSDNESLPIVGCGHTSFDHELKIIDSQSFNELKPFQIGEIVVSGPSVAKGYWDKPDISREIFELTLLNSNKKYLRTGDLGFLDEQGELFVTGRLKDLIILRGHNIYPQDIETTIHDCHPALIQHGCAAFIDEIDEEPELVIVQEVHRRAKDFDEIFNTILQRCGEDLSILPARIILIQQATLPKTSSGKVQRSACRHAVANDDVKIITEWNKASSNAKKQSVELNPNELQQWIKQWFANRLSIKVEDINPKANFAYYGVDSSLAIQFCGALEHVVHHEVNPSLLWEYSTMEQLADYLEVKPEKVAERPDLRTDQEHNVEPIAIIGMSCRFPGGANTPEEFWELLQTGRDGIKEVPNNRWNSDLYYDAQPATPGKIVTKKGGFIDNIDHFDAALFNISRLEAEAMDPQHRLLLELTWEALENAGIAPLSLDNTDTDVFVGISSHDYGQLAQRNRSYNPDAYYGIGNAHSAAAGRIAYFFGTHGEAIAVDTACSSSLVAAFNACQELHEKNCNLAIVGGVNVILDPALSVSFSQAGMLSPEGKCQVFDAKADGYVRSEGGGVLILKRLSDAQRDNDKILAVIQSAAVNSDGHSNGITAPSPKAQHDLIVKALHQAGLSADAIDYVEAHGTGTRLGDPIEFNALKEVFATGTRQKALYLGSLKSNIGHLEAAAGMAGLIKTVLMLQNQQIPANLHFDTVNPLINLSTIPAQVPTSLQPWETESAQVRHAAVSSFGFTGTNAHFILAEYQSEAVSNLVETAQRPMHIMTLSGHTPEALMAQKSNLFAFLQRQEHVDLARLCHSLAIGRSALDYRLAFSVQNYEELIATFEAPISVVEPIKANTNKIAFLFTGQGSQYTGMGLALYQSHPLFKSEVDQCCQLLADLLPEPLVNVMFAPENTHLLQQTQYVQPALFVLQYALAKLWLSWGVQPTAVIGHSVGEYVAATIAGVMSLADGLKLIACRGKLMQTQQAGSMLAVNVDSARALNLINEFKLHSPEAILNIAAVNSPSQVVFSGEHEAVKQFNQSCRTQCLRTTQLQVSHAFHSELMRPMLEEFGQIAATVEYHSPQMLLISNVSGQAISSLNATYWMEHVLASVQFSAGVRELIRLDYQTFIEVGPQPVLLAFAREHHVQPENALWLASLKKNQSNWQTLTEAVAEFYIKGGIINWHAYDAPFHIQPYATSLPVYSFQRQSYWLSSDQVFHENTILERTLTQSLYQMAWKPLKATNNVVQIESITGTWLVFANQNQECKNIVEQLSAHLPNLVVIYPSSEYREREQMTTLNPYKPGHFLNLLSGRSEVGGIIYLWGMLDSKFFQTDQLKTMTCGDFNQYLTGPCAGLLHLIQVLTQQQLVSKIWTVTRATTTLQQNNIPLFAPLLGMGKTLVLEHPEFNYQHLDVDANASIEEIVSQLYQLILKRQDEPLLSYQKGTIYAPRLTSVLVHDEDQNKKELLKEATYLITGGLGGLGSVLCKWLIQQEVTSIVLLGRRSLTEEIEEQINALAVEGIRVHYIQVDVSDYKQLRCVLSAVQNSMPTIKGIFHVAGVLNDGLWSNLSWQDFETVFQAKVKGSWNLHRLSIELMPELEHFIMFSSISSLLGSPGQANYAAANAFLDNLAHYRLRMRLPALSINFGPWQNIGMTRNLAQSWLTYGINNISEKLGLNALQHMMSLSFAQLCLMPNNIVAKAASLPSSYKKLLTEFFPTEIESLVAEPKAAQRAENELIRKLKEVGSEQRVSVLTEFLVNEIRSILRLKEHDNLLMNATLLSLGMDSISAAELLRRLRFNLTLENLSIQSLLFENRSIHDLVHLLTEKMTESEACRKKTTHSVPEVTTHLSQLSVQQIRIWRHIQAQPTNPAYLIANFFRLEGPVDAAILEKSIQQVIERHAMLRCSFHLSMGTAFQFFHDQIDFKLQHLDFSALNASDQHAQINQLLEQISHKQFDLSKAPLLASYLIQCSEQQYVWAFSISHLLADGVSSLIIFQDILHFYALNQKRISQNLALATPYQNFIDWQLDNVVNGTYERYVDFWRSRLQNYTPPVLPTDKLVLQQALTSGAKEPILFSAELLDGLQNLAKHSQVTLPNLLLAAYGVLIAQFAKTDNAFIAMLCAGREAERYQTTVGNISNELPLIIQCTSEMTFIAAATQLQNNLIQSFEYQYLQTEQIMELNLPVPDISFDFQNLELKPVDPGFQMKPLSIESAGEPLWGGNPRKLSLKLKYNGALLNGYLKYRVDLYDRETICYLTEQFLQIIREIIEKPERVCGNLADLSGAKL